MKHKSKKIINHINVNGRQQLLRYKKFIIYTFIGGGAVVIDFGLFSILSAVFDVVPLFANVLSIGTAILYSFLANTFFNFKTHDKLIRRFLSFGLISLSGLVISSSMLAYFAEYQQYNPILIKGASLPIVLVIQYYLNNRFTFKPTDDQAERISSHE